MLTIFTVVNSINKKQIDHGTPYMKSTDNEKTQYTVKTPFVLNNSPGCRTGNAMNIQ